MNQDRIPTRDQLLPNFDKEIIELKRSSLEELKKYWAKREFQNIVDIGRDVLSRLPAEAKGEGDKDISEIYFLTASALREIDKSSDEIMQMAHKSVNFNRNHLGSMWLIRELNSSFSDNSKFFKISVSGEYYAPTRDGVELVPFMTFYGVVADNPDEAMEFIKEFERPEIKNNIQLKDFHEAETESKLPKGIYSTSNLIGLTLSAPEEK